MSNRLEEIKKLTQTILEVNELQSAMEVMDIVNQYVGISPETLDNKTPSILQADCVRLTGFGFHLGVILADYESKRGTIKNKIDQVYANKFLEAKTVDPKRTVDQCNAIAEQEVFSLKEEEVLAIRAVSIVDRVSKASIEVVNMLKKVVERLLLEKHNN